MVWLSDLRHYHPDRVTTPPEFSGVLVWDKRLADAPASKQVICAHEHEHAEVRAAWGNDIKIIEGADVILPWVFGDAWYSEYKRALEHYRASVCD